MVKVLRGDGKVHDDYPQSYTVKDLEELERFLNQAKAVIPMRESVEGKHGGQYVAMRHDIDHDPDHALRFAEWEFERGFHSTYFMLHTAWYWGNQDLSPILDRMLELGHEIGLHIDAIGKALSEGIGLGILEPDVRKDAPPEILEETFAELRQRAAEIMHEELGWLRSNGFEIVGSCQHGGVEVSNYQIPNTDVYEAFPLDKFDLTYEAYFEHRKDTNQYYSDNHGSWHRGGDPVEVCTPPREWPAPAEGQRQPQILVHPCHWVIP